MKAESKSATNRITGILFLVVLSLSGCADVKVASWLTGEPDDAVLNGPRVVSGPDKDKERTWPNLAEVPDGKPSFSKVSVRNQETQDLKNDNLEALAEMERIRNIQIDDTRTREVALDDAEPFSFSALKP